MKRICAFFCLALTLLMCLTAAAEEANLIANGGFETLDASGNPKGWYPTAYRTQEGYSRIAITSEKAHSGQYSAVVENASANDARYTCTVSVDKNSYYRISCAVKTADVYGGAGANISIDGSLAASDGVYGQTDWQTIELIGKTGKDQTELTVCVRVGGYGAESTGKAYFDDVRLEKVDALPSGVIAYVWYDTQSYVSYDTATTQQTGQKSTALFVVLGVLFGVILTIADKKFKVEVDPRVEAVRACLGGANCGACGYAGCDAFADAVVAGKAPVNGCSPSGAKGAEAIAAIMGVSAEAEERKVARVICQGDCGVAKERYNYDGYTSCATAAGLAGGPKMCRFACIGLGDCAQACAFGAIKIADGLAHIDEEKCVACGQCANICPRGVIALKPVNETVIVSCRNTDSGREARAACMKACIACGRCIVVCPARARRFGGLLYKIVRRKFVKAYSVRKEPDIYV